MRIGVISAGSTRLLDSVARANGWPLVVREDLGAADQPDDVGLLCLAAVLMGVVGAQRGARPLEFAVLGGVQTRASLRDGLARLIRLEVAMTAFWTFSPLALPGAPEGDAAFDDLAAEAVRREIAVVFPAATGFAARCPGLVGCGGVLGNPPYLDAVAAPAGWPDTRPLVSSWADWATFRTAWTAAANPVEPLPEAAPFAVALGHPVWSIVAMLALVQAARATRATLAEQIDALKLACAPVSVRPDGATPLLGFFEPRLLDQAFLEAERRDAAARHPA